MKFNRVFVIVLDSLGVGETIDAINYGDVGANTLKHIYETNKLFVPNLKKLGFLNLIETKDNESDAYFTFAKPTNPGKDTLNGHYEMMGVKVTRPFKIFSNGFPQELINKIEKETKRRVIGNVSASGTEIIKQLGEMQIQTGSLIIYTSSDSVLQVAAHEKIIPLDMLYKYCEIIRNITMKDEWLVGRIIARPFIGNNSANFKRTENRHDYALNPPMASVLDALKENNFSVISIGKIYDIFNGSGITKKVIATNNKEGIEKILEVMDKNFTGLCLTNLNDFDTLYGHRRNSKGYAEAIQDFDIEIPLILNSLRTDDLLIITADHGNDPTFKGTDHTRENVPVLIYSRIFKEPKRLPAFESLADIGATIADNFCIKKPTIGTSFLEKLK